MWAVTPGWLWWSRPQTAGDLVTVGEIADVLLRQLLVARYTTEAESRPELLGNAAPRVPIEVVRPGDRIALLDNGPEIRIGEVERVREWPGVRVVTVEGERLFFDLSETVVLVRGGVS